MRALKTTVAVSLAALTLAMGLAATPASAHPMWGHHGGYWGPAAAFGLFGAVVGAGIIANSQCGVVYRPVYDAWGNYRGQRAFNTCY